MTRRGEAGRALGASYMAALIGGLFGALLMAVALPILRPIILYIGSPELLGVAVFGISMVAVLSGNAPLRGLTAACFGMMLSMIGTDPQIGHAALDHGHVCICGTACRWCRSRSAFSRCRSCAISPSAAWRSSRKA